MKSLCKCSFEHNKKYHEIEFILPKHSIWRPKIQWKRLNLILTESGPKQSDFTKKGKSRKKWPHAK